MRFYLDTQDNHKPFLANSDREAIEKITKNGDWRGLKRQRQDGVSLGRLGIYSIDIPKLPGFVYLTIENSLQFFNKEELENYLDQEALKFHLVTIEDYFFAFYINENEEIKRVNWTDLNIDVSFNLRGFD